MRWGSRTQIPRDIYIPDALAVHPFTSSMAWPAADKKCPAPSSLLLPPPFCWHKGLCRHETSQGPSPLEKEHSRDGTTALLPVRAALWAGFLDSSMACRSSMEEVMRLRHQHQEGSGDGAIPCLYGPSALCLFNFSQFLECFPILCQHWKYQLFFLGIFLWQCQSCLFYFQ